MFPLFLTRRCTLLYFYMHLPKADWMKHHVSLDCGYIITHRLLQHSDKKQGILNFLKKIKTKKTASEEAVYIIVKII